MSVTVTRHRKGFLPVFFWLLAALLAFIAMTDGVSTLDDGFGCFDASSDSSDEGHEADDEGIEAQLLQQNLQSDRVISSDCVKFNTGSKA